MRRRLKDIDRELIRRAPEGPGTHYRLMELFGISLSTVIKIRNGKRGFRIQNGLGSRPWELRSRDLVESWRARALERIEAGYRRALECIENDEVVETTGLDRPGPAGIFAGKGKGGRPRQATLNAAPQRDDWIRRRRPRSR